MKYNLMTIILDYDGDPATMSSESVEPMTWRRVIQISLNNFMPGEQLNKEEKLDCFNLSVRVGTTKEVELTAKEKALIIDRIGKVMSPLFVGRAVEFFK